MRCNICDKKLTDKEIVFNKDLGAYEPCSTCLEVAMDAAYSDGFQHEGDDKVILIGEESSEDGVADFLEFKDHQPLGHTLD